MLWSDNFHPGLKIHDTVAQGLPKRWLDSDIIRWCILGGARFLHWRLRWVDRKGRWTGNHNFNLCSDEVGPLALLSW